MSRLLILASEFPPGPGGIGSHACHFAAHMTASGWQVRVLTFQDYAVEEEIERFNCAQPFEIKRLSRPKVRLLDVTGRWQRLRETLRSWEPDVLVATGDRQVWLTACVLLLDKWKPMNRWNLPWCAVWHGSTPRYMLERQFTRWAFQQPDLTISVSEYSMCQLQKLSTRLRQGLIIPNGANEKQLYPDLEAGIKLRRELGLGDALLLLTVGHVTERKGQDIVIRGPSKLNELESPKPLSPHEVNQLAEEGVTILDGRDYLAFGGAHIPGAWNIDMAGNFQTFSGWMLPPDKPIVLVLENDTRVNDAVTMLRRVGFDHVIGWLEGGMHTWSVGGFPTGHVQQISVQELAGLTKQKPGPMVLDVRGKLEFETLNLGGALHMQAPDTRKRYREIPKDKTVYIICNSGHRSSLACSVLKQHGIHDVTNVAGGMTAYSAAGLIGAGPTCTAPHLPVGKEVHGVKSPFIKGEYIYSSL